MAFFALLLLGAAALLFDLRTARRLPSSADWAEAAAALRKRVQPGDAVLPWPPWAERARLVVDAAPVLIEEDLVHADLPGVLRLWLLGLPEAPFADLAGAEAALRARGAQPQGEKLRFGALTLQAFQTGTPPLESDLLAGPPFTAPWPEWHEVQYAARRCRHVAPGAPDQPLRLLVHGGGSRLQLRAGVIGERAYDLPAPVRVEARQGGRPLAAVTVERTVDPRPGWLAAEAQLQGGPAQELELLVSTAQGRPPLCISAWTTR